MYSSVWIRWVAYIMSTYLLFNAYSYLFASNNMIITPRNQFVFDHIISRPGIAIIYMAVAIFLAVGFSFPKLLSPGLAAVGVINLFWGTVSVLPALLGAISTGSWTGASTLYAFGFVLILLSFVSYRTYNWKPKNI